MKTFMYVFYVISFVILLLEYFLFSAKSPVVSYSLYGFFGCILLITISKFLGKAWLQKGEDYYD